MCILMWKGESYQQPCEREMGRVDKQRARDDVDEREHKVNKTELSKVTSIPYKQLQGSREVPTRHRYGQTQQHGSVPRWAACALMHAAQGTDARN